jgi:hypothetical protein
LLPSVFQHKHSSLFLYTDLLYLFFGPLVIKNPFLIVCYFKFLLCYI